MVDKQEMNLAIKRMYKDFFRYQNKNNPTEWVWVKMFVSKTKNNNSLNIHHGLDVFTKYTVNEYKEY